MAIRAGDVTDRNGLTEFCLTEFCQTKVADRPEPIDVRRISDSDHREADNRLTDHDPHSV